MATSRDILRRISLRTRLVASFVVALALAWVVGFAVSDRVQSAGQQERVYYIAADEVEWDYAPGATNLITGEPFSDEERVFVERGAGRIGKVYRKAVYREYADSTFASRKRVEPQWEHLGILGPVVRAEVGDTVRVIFKNNTQIPLSIHAHGVLYDKRSEGARYNDGTAGADKEDDEVAPGGTHTYIWQVPERAGPGPHDSSSIVWMYHSHVGSEVADTNAGLVGPIIVSGRGTTKADRTPRDVDREFITLFTVFDENVSPYLDRNVQTYLGPGRVNKGDEDFVESNLKHSINGFLFGHLPGLNVRRGERARWYVMALGTEVDLHTPHWHGLTVLSMGMRMDNLDLLPGSMKVADMVADNPGTWLYHCHVNDHITAGMQALFRIAS